MILSYDEILKSNKIRDILKNSSEPEQLELMMCKKCHGTGLSNLRYSVVDHKWEATTIDTSSFCDFCNGIGYTKNMSLKYKCNICAGSGVIVSDNMWSTCKKCDGLGYHDDWIKNVLI